MIDDKTLELFKMLTIAVHKNRLVLIDGTLKDGTPCPVLAIKMGAFDHNNPNGVCPIGNLAWKHPEELYEVATNERVQCIECTDNVDNPPEGAEILGHLELPKSKDDLYNDSDDFIPQ